MFCGECGAKNKKGDAFCCECGAKLESGEVKKTNKGDDKRLRLRFAERFSSKIRCIRPMLF